MIFHKTCVDMLGASKFSTFYYNVQESLISPQVLLTFLDFPKHKKDAERHEDQFGGIISLRSLI